jgi:hypothetical protein
MILGAVFGAGPGGGRTGGCLNGRGTGDDRREARRAQERGGCGSAGRLRAVPPDWRPGFVRPQAAGGAVMMFTRMWLVAPGGGQDGRAGRVKGTAALKTRARESAMAAL